MNARLFNVTIDEQAQGGLEVLQVLDWNSDNMQRGKNGLWVVEGQEEKIQMVGDAYPEVVMKVEPA